MIATQDDYAIIESGSYTISFRLEVLSHLYMTEREIQGSTKSIRCNISSSSDVRRTCTLVMTVEDESMVEDSFEIDWLDKLVRPYIAVQGGGHTREYLLGTYLLNTDTSKYDATSRELTLNLVDIMAVATQSRGSQIGSDILIPFGSNMRNAIIAFVARFLPFKMYNVCEFPDVIPYDQEFAIGTYPYEVLSQLLTLFPYYEQYYDSNGIYTIQAIPTGLNDHVAIDETFLDDLIISEERSGTLGNIKNSTEIWGAELNALYSASNCVTYTEGDIQTYILVMSTMLETIEANSTFSFVPGNTNTEKQYIKLEGHDTAFRLYDSKGVLLEANKLVANRSYVIKFVYVNLGDALEGRFYLQGEEIIHVIVREMNAMPTADEIAADKIKNDCDNIRYIINPDSPYACDRNGLSIVEGEVKQVLNGGDYSFIYTTELGCERAAYENYCRTRLNTEVSLKTILIPWIDVNMKIRYTSPRTGEVHQYLVKDLDMNLTEFTMTLKLTRFYNAYPWL